MLALLLLAACAPPQADRFLAWQRADDGTYTVAPRDLGALTDLSAVSGDLGAVRQGGRVTFDDDGGMTHRGSRALHVGYGVQGSTAVPLDADGLLLWSFYAHLEDIARELPEHGLDPEVFFPVGTAWTPVIPDVMLELLPLKNAAYATGGHFFILLADLADKDVPLAANAGIVRHEFGHAIFHHLTCGAPLAAPPFDAADQRAGSLYYSSLHEGFADSFAGLTLDDPAFLAASLDLEERRLDGDQTLEGVELPEEFIATSDEELLAIYDPYALGSVIAAAAWDLRVALDDPERSLEILIVSARAWSEAEEFGDAWGFLQVWAATAAPGAEHEALCASLTARFGEHAPAECAQ
ncbi:MAG: hypothetical protein ABIO70_21445 [Pseudomonadota bacterium]